MSRKTNVIWIFGDQHRGQSLSCNGDHNVNTPNIDKLAKEGINFTRAISGYPQCCPFRGSLLTSIYPNRCIPGFEMALPKNMKTIAHIFNENDYDTAYFGKWHISGKHTSISRPDLQKVMPEERGGFQKWIGYDNTQDPYDTNVHGFWKGECEFKRLEAYETDALTDKFIEYIKEASNAEDEKPFFAVLSVTPPHAPYESPYGNRRTPMDIVLRENVPNVSYVVEQARRELIGYYDMIENLDYNIGRIRNILEDLGEWQNTCVLFFSDHGDMHGSHGYFRKMTAYEEAIRIPFIIGGGFNFDKNIKLAHQTNTLINHVDIAPTTLGLAGIEVPSWMEGTDFSYERTGSINSSFKHMDSAYIQSIIPSKNKHSVNKPWRGIVTEDGWKYVTFEGFPWLLFNLNEDPYEQVNLAHSNFYYSKFKELNNRLAEWIKETRDEFTVPNY